jgi:TatD DNase family protein
VAPATSAWVDSHCHLPDDLDAARTVVAAARSVGVDTMITVGCDRASSIVNLGHAAELDGVFGTVGLHPHEARHGVATIIDLLDPATRPAELAAPVAVGECGLDFHYDLSPRDAQRDVFAAQIELAHRYELPLVIHTREAWAETFDLLDTGGVPARTIFHCFTGGPDEAAACVERGAFVSFSGIVTFKGAPEVAAAAAVVPLGHLLVETDSPYLAPVPHRGRPNQPAWVIDVGRRVADVRSMTASAIRDATAANAERAFPLLITR